jgi:hypothetical protein
MTYTNIEGREQLLETLADATDQIGSALEAVSAAHEELDDMNADRLEEAVFAPVQRAYGAAKRTYTEFASRHELPGRTFDQPPTGPAPASARELIDSASESAGAAEATLTSLQDERALIEVGDVQLRAGVASVREAIGDVPQRADQFLSTLGR